MSATVLHLPKRRDALIAEWLRRLDDCDPDSSAALAIYAEADAAGLIDQLGAALRVSGEAMMREASRLRTALAKGEP